MIMINIIICWVAWHRFLLPLNSLNEQIEVRNSFTQIFIQIIYWLFAQFWWPCTILMTWLLRVLDILNTTKIIPILAVSIHTPLNNLIKKCMLKILFQCILKCVHFRMNDVFYGFTLVSVLVLLILLHIGFLLFYDLFQWYNYKAIFFFLSTFYYTWIFLIY